MILFRRLLLASIGFALPLAGASAATHRAHRPIQARVSTATYRVPLTHAAHHRPHIVRHVSTHPRHRVLTGRS